MQLKESIEVEQARYIHRNFPTAVLGGLLVAGLVVVVFRSVVPTHYIYAWIAALALMSLVRMVSWRRFRGAALGPENAARWLREATIGAFVSGLLWGAGSLFLFPPDQVVYQFTFVFALVMMATAAMFSYAPHYPTYLAYFVPSMVPGIFGLAFSGGGGPQLGMAVGVGMMITVVLWSVRSLNRTFLESMRLRLENVALVTELTVQKDAAESANLAKSRFLAAASHDLRQPIHALNLYLGAFAQVELPRGAGTLLGKVRQCAQIMDEMFRALLDISKLDAGAVQPQLSVFCLAPLLARTRIEFEPQARAKGLELSVLRCSGFVKSDSVLTERILRNLVSNAIRYTESGKVVVGCRRRGNALRVSVYDTGLGIEASQQALVFEEFYQVGNPERDRSKGLGLGLAIVDRLAKLLGAPVTLYSRPARGSLFAFDLPRAEQVDVPALQLPLLEGVNRNLAGTLIVVVDDEELILDAAQTLLEQWHCTVIAAASGESALRQLARSKRAPDMLICDYRLRDGENGIGVIELLRNEFNEDIPALLLTGDTEQEQIRRIAASGLAVLHKPLREDELNDAIRALCMPQAQLRL